MTSRRNFLQQMGLSLFSLLLFQSCDNHKSTTSPKGDEPAKVVREYVYQNLERIAHAQERDIGIKHFVMPQLELKGCGFRGEREFFDTDTQVLTLFLPRSYTHFSAYTTDELIRHGLGHFYANKLSMNLGNSSWPPVTNDEMAKKVYGIVAEGIAEYFRRKSFDESDSFKDSDWPTNEAALANTQENNLFYAGGYHLVKPIIDQYGSNGLNYVIINSSSVTRPQDLPAWRDRVIAELESKRMLKGAL